MQTFSTLADLKRRWKLYPKATQFLSQFDRHNSYAKAETKNGDRSIYYKLLLLKLNTTQGDVSLRNLWKGKHFISIYRNFDGAETTH